MRAELNQNLRVVLSDVRIDRHQFKFTYRLGEIEHHTVIDYHDIDLQELCARFGLDSILRLAYHTAAVEGLKFCTLFPAEYDLSIGAKFWGKGWGTLLAVIYSKVFAEHRYRHNASGYLGPKLLGAEPASIWGSHPIIGLFSIDTVLLSSGGGKDSLAMMLILQEAGVPYHLYQYAHSQYGDCAFQHSLTQRSGRYFDPQSSNRLSIREDFLVHSEEPAITAETPTSVFQALPVMLARRTRHLVMGHERSSNSPNTVDSESLETINHQWGKSTECEILLENYIRTNLIGKFQFWSVLRPLYDYSIFKILNRHPELAALTHSCNRIKPWCLRCAKCAYVWLSLGAYVRRDVAQSISKENLFNVPELQSTFDQLMGLEGHRPFECVGEVGEVHLALSHFLIGGQRNKVVDRFRNCLLPRINPMELLDWYSGRYWTDARIPEHFLSRIYIAVEDLLEQSSAPLRSTG